MTPIADTTRMALTNASIYGSPNENTILLEGDRIRAIGRSEDLLPTLPDDATCIDLDKHAVLPGFIDAHIHLLHTGLVESGWRIGLMGLSRDDALAALADAVNARGGDWVVGYGWDESTWKKREYLSKQELDAIAPDSPVLAIRMDGHLLVANSQALESLPEAAPRDLVEWEEGCLREKAVSVMTEMVQPDKTAAVEALDAAAQLCHQLGITTVHTMTRLAFFDAFLCRRDQRQLRVIINPDVQSFDKLDAVGLKTGFGDQWLRFGGVKIFADGSIGAANAAVSEPYCSGGLGELNHSDDVIHGWIHAADQSGWQTVVHAIGDRAIEQVLKTHETLKTNADLRHRIEHFELPRFEQLARVKAAGLYLSMQPNFTANWSGPDSMYIDRLGVDRDRESNPLRWIVDAGLPLAFGSDGMPPSPLYGLHGAISGAYAEQRLSIEEAIGCYTEGGASFAFEEDEKGCLRPGKLADLVVLDEDPRSAPNDVLTRRVMMTFVGGRLVYSDSGVPSASGEG